MPTLLAGLSALVIFNLWPKLKFAVPVHIPTVVVVSFMALILNQQDYEVATIGSTFRFTLADGTLGGGIPSMLADFQCPWLCDQADEVPLVLSWPLTSDLLSAAFSLPC